MSETSRAPQEAGERPGLEHEGGATWWHSRVRYLFARQLAGGRRVLDLACGNGFGTALLAEVAAEVVGADHDDRAVSTAARDNARPNARYERAAVPLPFEDGAFDLVVCLETLEHLRAADQPAFVAELERVLAADGLLVLSTPEREAEATHALVTGARNEFHLHTPSAAELDRLTAGLPQQRRFVELDVVATALVPAAPGERARALEAPLTAWEPRGRAVPVSVVRVCARTSAALAPALELRPPVAYRADYQRLALLTTAAERARLAPLTGLPAEEQLALLVERFDRLLDRLDRLEVRGERVAHDVHLINRNLSVAGWVARLRSLLGGR